METQTLVAKKLKALIKEKFKQQKIFAKEMNISENTITYWLKKGVMPNLETLDRIAKHCNIDISYFFNDESNANIVDEKLFDKVFSIAYDFADENDIEISGSYFLGCYDLVTTMMIKDNTDYITAFNNSKQLILKLTKKN